jgi:hypothetical protein
MNKGYQNSAIIQFEYYKMLGDKTFSQLEEVHFFWQFNTESNSIANIVKHLSGNMLSRWTDFLTTDGEKDWRDRDSEFENSLLSKQEILGLWEKGWECLFTSLNALTENDFQKEIYIRNMGHILRKSFSNNVTKI